MALGRTTEPTEDDDKSGLDLRGNGDVHVWVDGKRFRFRIRKFREFVALIDNQREAMDELRALSDEALAWSSDLQAELAEGEGRTPTPDERSEDVKRGRQIEDRTNELALEWWELAVATLLGDDSGWDPEEHVRPWMANFATIADILSLEERPFPVWRTVDPSRPSAEPLEDTDLSATQQECAAVYAALAAPGFQVVGKGSHILYTRRGFAPHEVDEMPMYVIARLLHGDQPTDQGMTQADFEAEAAARARSATPEQLAEAAERAARLAELVEAGEPPL